MTTVTSSGRETSYRSERGERLVGREGALEGEGFEVEEVVGAAAG